MLGKLLKGAAVRLTRIQSTNQFLLAMVVLLASASLMTHYQAEAKVETVSKSSTRDQQTQMDSFATKDAPVIVLNENNWRRMLKGEWMVEFYAPWCPACKSLAPIWERFGKSLLDLQVNVAKVDVTTSTSLSGRFFVTALPTIYHVKDGEFRHYRGLRDYEALMFFIKQKQWSKLDPVSIWKRPDTVHMSILSYIFKLSHTLKEFNALLQQEYGLPSWGAYALFAVGTIFVGAILGLTLVCLIDLLYPPKKAQRQSYIQGRKKNESGVEDLANDELLDDATAEDAAESALNMNDKNEVEGMENVMDIDDEDDEEEQNTDGKEKSGEVAEGDENHEKKKNVKADEPVFDDADSVHTSDGEKNSRSESEEVESEVAKATGEVYNIITAGEKGSTSPGEMRKRKPRKAD